MGIENKKDPTPVSEATDRLLADLNAEDENIGFLPIKDIERANRALANPMPETNVGGSAEPVAWLRLIKITRINGDEHEVPSLADEGDKGAFPVYRSLPSSLGATK